MIRWKIYQNKDRSWKYRIDYNESAQIAWLSGAINSRPTVCYEELPIERRRVKYLQDKLLDIVIHLDDLNKRFRIVAAKELLGL